MSIILFILIAPKIVVSNYHHFDILRKKPLPVTYKHDPVLSAYIVARRVW